MLKKNSFILQFLCLLLPSIVFAIPNYTAKLPEVHGSGSSHQSRCSDVDLCDGLVSCSSEAMSKSTIEIDSAEDLLNLQRGRYYVLTKDIFLPSDFYAPDLALEDIVFDGAGHKITHNFQGVPVFDRIFNSVVINLNVEVDAAAALWGSAPSAPLVTYLGSGSCIQDVHVRGGQVRASAGMIGSFGSGSTAIYGPSGAIVPKVTVVKDSSAEISIVANTTNEGLLIGGVEIHDATEGELYLQVNHSYAKGSITAPSGYSPGAHVGGLIGRIRVFSPDGGGPHVKVLQSYAEANIDGAMNGAGGLIGDVEVGGYVQADGSTKRSNSHIVIEQSFSKGSVSHGTNTYVRTSGFVGSGGYFTIKDSYSQANISGYHASGFSSSCGVDEGAITNVYATGQLTTAYTSGTVQDNHLSGFALSGRDSAVTNAFFDSDVAGITQTRCGVAKTTAQLQDESALRAAGWDFDNVWEIRGPNQYPVLQWQD